MVIHLAGRFIWYESFRDYISKKKRNYAALSFLILGLVNLLIFTYLFSQPGRLVPMYKTALVLGWLPYFLLSFLWCRRWWPSRFSSWACRGSGFLSSTP